MNLYEFAEMYKGKTFNFIFKGKGYIYKKDNVTKYKITPHENIFYEATTKEIDETILKALKVKSFEIDGLETLIVNVTSSEIKSILGGKENE